MTLRRWRNPRQSWSQRHRSRNPQTQLAVGGATLLAELMNWWGQKLLEKRPQTERRRGGRSNKERRSSYDLGNATRCMRMGHDSSVRRSLGKPYVQRRMSFGWYDDSFHKPPKCGALGARSWLALGRFYLNVCTVCLVVLEFVFSLKCLFQYTRTSAQYVFVLVFSFPFEQCPLKRCGNFRERYFIKKKKFERSCQIYDISCSLRLR